MLSGVVACARCRRLEEHRVWACAHAALKRAMEPSPPLPSHAELLARAFDVLRARGDAQLFIDAELPPLYPAEPPAELLLSLHNAVVSVFNERAAELDPQYNIERAVARMHSSLTGVPQSVDPAERVKLAKCVAYHAKAYAKRARMALLAAKSQHARQCKRKADGGSEQQPKRQPLLLMDVHSSSPQPSPISSQAVSPIAAVSPNTPPLTIALPTSAPPRRRPTVVPGKPPCCNNKCPVCCTARRQLASRESSCALCVALLGEKAAAVEQASTLRVQLSQAASAREDAVQVAAKVKVEAAQRENVLRRQLDEAHLSARQFEMADKAARAVHKVARAANAKRLADSEGLRRLAVKRRAELVQRTDWHEQRGPP